MAVVQIETPIESTWIQLLKLSTRQLLSTCTLRRGIHAVLAQQPDICTSVPCLPPRHRAPACLQDPGVPHQRLHRQGWWIWDTSCLDHVGLEDHSDGREGGQEAARSREEEERVSERVYRLED